VLRVGVVFDENAIETVRGRITTEALPELSVAVMTTGKFWSGCANTAAVMVNESGLEGVRNPCGVLRFTCELLGGPETLTPSCGGVAALLVTEICTVAIDAGLTETDVGET
jgi:hypothetical protein